MLSYEVMATVEPRQAGEYERYMRERHIPDVMATGCFLAAAFARAAPGRYRTRYDAASAQDLERYQAAHAARLRAEFAARFPGATPEREVWVVLETWTAGREPR